jgi:hypothetical protein
MRTTLTIDRDVAALLRQAQARRKEPLKRIVNEALRQGLLQMTAPARRQGQYRMKPVDLGRCLIGNLDDVAEALATAEGEAHR